MSTPQPLDLAALDPPIWYVQVEAETYGPYTLGQLQAFIDEGRVTAASLISQHDDTLFRAARDIAELALLLLEEAPAAQPATGSNFIIIARGPDGEVTDTRRDVLQVLNAYGSFAETLPGVFILRSAQRLADIRAHLEQAASQKIQFLIVETEDGRLGWLGMTDETDRHIRSVWNAKID